MEGRSSILSWGISYLVESKPCVKVVVEEGDEEGDDDEGEGEEEEEDEEEEGE